MKSSLLYNMEFPILFFYKIELVLREDFKGSRRLSPIVDTLCEGSNVMRKFSLLRVGTEELR